MVFFRIPVGKPDGLGSIGEVLVQDIWRNVSIVKVMMARSTENMRRVQGKQGIRMSLALGGFGPIIVFASVCLDCVVHEDDKGDGRHRKQDSDDDAEHDLYLSCYDMGTGSVLVFAR